MAVTPVVTVSGVIRWRLGAAAVLLSLAALATGCDSEPDYYATPTNVVWLTAIAAIEDECGLWVHEHDPGGWNAVVPTAYDHISVSSGEVVAHTSWDPEHLWQIDQWISRHDPNVSTPDRPVTDDEAALVEAALVDVFCVADYQ